jgi:hypothetical protein
LATPVTIPAGVTLATFGASDCQPVVIACDCPFESDAVAVAWAVSSTLIGLFTVTAMADVVGDAEVGRDPFESLSQALAATEIAAHDSA